MIGFLSGVTVAALAIIAAEIKFKYSLGDEVADFFRSKGEKILAYEAKAKAYAERVKKVLEGK